MDLRAENGARTVCTRRAALAHQLPGQNMPSSKTIIRVALIALAAMSVANRVPAVRRIVQGA